MIDQFGQARTHLLRGGIVALFGLLALGLLAGSAQAGSPAARSTGAAPQITPGQDFQDVVPSDPFYTFLHNLYLAHIVSGYTCQPGGPSDPCVLPDNLPYYHPGVTVTRLQMTKFLDLGRRNIADAVGTSLILTKTSSLVDTLIVSSTAASAIHGLSGSQGGEGVIGECTRANTNCYGVEGLGVTGTHPGWFQGGTGSYFSSSDAGYSGLEAHGTSTTAYGGELWSNNYRAGYVKTLDTSRYSLYVDTLGGGLTDEGLYVNGQAHVVGNLIVDGSKTGYVVDAMQNADSTALEPGDVVVIVGSSAPVLGRIPVVTVKKATSAYDSGVVGIVDQALYVPDPATKAAYDAQEQAIRAAMLQRATAEAAAAAGQQPDLTGITIPASTISDAQGTVHALADVTSVAQGGYLNVVTLGAYPAVKVDASFGAIHAGDMLVSSPHPGYAMRADPKQIQFGTVIGKALGDLATGTGTIPLMVTLK